MDVQIDKTLTATGPAAQRVQRHPERQILIYWVLAVGLGLLTLRDLLGLWNVPVTLGRPWLVAYLILSFGLSQVLYMLVARHDGRPLHAGSLAIFALGNGIAETFAFAMVFRAGEFIGAGLFALFAPGLASAAGFALGVALFIVYGGLIHGLFWLRVLPPHLADTPRARTIRKLRPIAEVGLVLGWSLCFWLTRDIWTVIFFHILVDIGLILKVRPAIFGAGRRPQ